MPYPVTIGKRTRMSFSKIKEIADLPNLIEIQVDSYKWFLEEGLKEVFNDISPIEDYTGNLILEFVDYSLDDKPKYDIEECKERDATYCAPLKVKVRLINKETGEIKEQEVFMGDFPLMTDRGTFVINGAERVIVSQLVRSPGVYYALERDKTGKKLISSTVIPNRGAWLEYETDSNDVISVRVDRTRKQPVTVLLRALGIGTDEEIKELLEQEGFEVEIYESAMEKIMKLPKEEMAQALGNVYAGKRPIAELTSKYDLIINIANVNASVDQRLQWPPSKGTPDIPFYVNEIPTIFISVKCPFHLADVPQVKTYINTYDDNQQTLEALVEKLVGNTEFKGISPVDAFCGFGDTRF